MTLIALYFGMVAVGLSVSLVAARLANGADIEAGDWAPHMISVNAVVMVALFAISMAA